MYILIMLQNIKAEGTMIIIVLLSLIISNSAFAAPEAAVDQKKIPLRKQLIISPPKLSMGNELIKSQVVKTTLSILIKSGMYDLTIGSSNTLTDSNTALFQLDLEILGEKEHYLIIRLVDVRQQSVVKIVRANKIPKRLLLLQLRMSIYELLYGREFVQRYLQLIKDEYFLGQNFDAPEIQQNRMKTPDIDAGKGSIQDVNLNKKKRSDKIAPQKKTKEKKLKKRDKKDKNQEREINKKGDGLTTGKGEKKDESTPLDRSVEAKSKSLSSKDKDKINQKDKDKKTAVKGQELKINQKTEQVPPDTLSLKRGENKTKISTTRTLFDIKYRVGISYLDSTVASQDIIQVTNKYQFQIIQTAFEIKASGAQDSSDYLGIQLAMGPPIGNNEYDTPTYKKFDIFYSRMPKNLELNFLAGGSYSELNFVNLDEIGSGLKAANSKIFWLLVGAEKDFNLFSRQHLSKITIEKSFLSSTSYGTKGQTMALNGMQFTISQLSQIYKNYLLSASYQLGSYDSKSYPIVAEQSSFLLSVLYQF